MRRQQREPDDEAARDAAAAESEAEMKRMRDSYPTPMGLVKGGVGLRAKNTIVDSGDFFVPSGKEQGRETASVSGRITTDVVKMMDALIGSRTTKFSTRGELVTAAVYWFIVENIMPKHNTGRIHQGMKLMVERTQAAKTMAENLDLQSFQLQHRRMLEKLLALGALDDAVFEYKRMIAIAEQIHPRFEARVAVWAEQEPSFEKIRAALDTVFPPGARDLCACSHAAKEHDGEPGEFPGSCLVGECTCMEWCRPRRRTDG